MSVVTVDELIKGFDREAPKPALRASSGFAELDQVAGGLVAGQVWIVTGEAGHGKTTLLTQWAAHLAREGWRTALVCPREPHRFMAARLLACSGPVPLQSLHRGEEAPASAWLFKARSRLMGRSLRVAAKGDGTFLSGGDQTEVQSLDSILIDDADLSAGVFPERIASFAGHGALVVLSMPRHVLVLGKDSAQHLEPSWARVADVVVEVRLTDGYDGQPNPRPGEADLIVLKNRWGPARSVSVGFHGHYSRFVDIPPDER